ncbi:hypothetical protein IKF67_01495 [Candidatus Saccharibacteria bacterium]|nr:hypothetical protein [Candidatus Saccharibacteria bacterium]
MDQEKLFDILSDKILDQLPGEAITKLAELSKLEGDHNAEIQKILDDNNIKLEEIAKSIAEREQ